jgi:uncharacterized protein YkwD
MDLILSLLLQLQNAQASLSHMQAARSARPEITRARQAPVQAVQPVATPAPVQAAPVQTAPVSPSLQNSDTATQIEQYVLQNTNAFRAQNGLPALVADTTVAAVARAHSADMLSKHYFDHTNPQGCGPACRLTNVGYVWRSYGENIHWMSGYKLNAQASAQKIVNDWINSPPHRANLLGAFTYAGVGIAMNGDTIYTTTDYTTK